MITNHDLRCINNTRFLILFLFTTNHAEAVKPLHPEALDVDQWRWRADFSINCLAKVACAALEAPNIAGYFVRVCTMVVNEVRDIPVACTFVLRDHFGINVVLNRVSREDTLG
jgi:hypothetical protein